MWTKLQRFFVFAALLSSVAAAAEPLALRQQFDSARNRVWTLTHDGVVARDMASGKTLGEISLPGWIWAGAPYSCSPDLALGPRGEVLITSDVLPVIWRIDPETLAVSRHELVLDADGDKDIGFSALAYSPRHGAFFATSAVYGSLWRIDPLLRRAQKIALSEAVIGACEVGVRPMAHAGKTNRLSGFCIGTMQERRSVELAPDQRFAYVRVGSC
jgi:hypothetical protein